MLCSFVDIPSILSPLNNKLSTREYPPYARGVGRTHVLVGNLVTSREHVIGAHASTSIITPAPLTQLHHYLTLIFSLHQFTLKYR